MTTTINEIYESILESLDNRRNCSLQESKEWFELLQNNDSESVHNEYKNYCMDSLLSEYDRRLLEFA